MRTTPAYPILLFALAGLLAACGDDPAAPEEPPPIVKPAVWTELHGLPPATTLYALWVPRDDYVIGVGPGGTVMRWDGQEWATIANDGTRNLYAIAGVTGGETVAVGDGGEIVRFETTQFVKTTGATTENLRGLWTPGGSAFTAVGSGGVILRGDGNAWSLDTSPVVTPLFGVWGSGVNDVFAVGLNGVIIHFDGTAWTPMASGSNALLAAVAGSASDDVYAVGEAGTVLHYDGAAWSPMVSGTQETLQGVTAGNRTVAVGANGTVISLAGGSWNTEPAITGEWLYGAAQSGASTWVVGARAILHDGGAGWAPETRGAVPQLSGITGPPHTPLRVVGGGGYVARQLGDAWHWEDAGNARTFNAIWCEPGGDVFAVGSNRIVHHDGIAWVEEYNSPVELLDVAGGPSGVYAVGTGGAILRRNSGVWTSVRPTTPVFNDLRAYTSLAGDEAYIVGSDGRLLAFNGAAWVVSDSRITTQLNDVTGSVPGSSVRAAAVGETSRGGQGTIIGLSPVKGRGWEAMPSPTPKSLLALARGPQGRLYAVGQSGVVIAYDGTAWSVVPSPTLKTLRGAWSDGKRLFVTGGEQTSGTVVLRYATP
ncbi:MAG: hypothetical protein OEV86_05495 [Candidatus Krumholzibacteria bacterium]|nr:hypothetical protein [Candidatus Krumholzibacteria bacterium]